eukprot:Amastigsp_a340049_181.p3 type:complete len:146 gc:universal Amastigsp_a340049_181:636-199(-)
MPLTMSMGDARMALGSSAATASMSMPPRGEAIMTGPLCSRSRTMAKYFSSSMSSASATITLLTGTPSGGVCLVMRLCPSIEPASLAASAGVLARWTPPLKPFEKWPLPRPPALTWALITNSLPSVNFIALAPASASSAVDATLNC